MEIYWIGFLSVAALIFCLAFGVPVAVSMGLTGFIGLYLTTGSDAAFSMLKTIPYHVVANFFWAVLPLFILMGNLAAAAGITQDLFESAKTWLGAFRGGLYHAVIWGSAAFGAASGSTVVNAVVFTKLALPQMLQQGYSKSLSIGCIASAGTFAAMIPPSLTMVIYCIITEVPLGKLMIAGIFPGVLTALNYSIFIWLFVRLKPSSAPEISGSGYSFKEKFFSLKKTWAVGVCILLVFGGIWGGFFAPSIAGAVGAFGFFLISLHKLGFKKRWLIEELRNSAGTACIIFTILIGGQIFSRFLVLQGVIPQFIEMVTSAIRSEIGLIAFFTIIYLVLGCVMDTASIMVITLPFLFPLVQKYQIDPIFFGILFIKLIEVATLTPPVGLNLYATVSATNKECNIGNAINGILPFLGVETITLLELILFPEITLWLPNTMLSG